ncbi:hypothetical protein [Xenorhabdus koppenhoeferi]|uniref:DNA methylase n=1 Tax=Xenorhabdus koppenhoeferi TaxID=351659 RepID=A0A1I7JZ80_9GAMM|nr:hypothetical protein [Xenorhabdus koppenhoeferi]SFU90439.1 hypothetical protein SAMN05421784_14223 [Xenorhabdus koppenhoeferi]
MADAKAHKLGQMIGEFIEKHFEGELLSICEERGLYLDVVGKVRKARRGKKVSWIDIYGSYHDLDFVIERNGTEQDLGVPAALIECAWRRYTKHSKNKAQEIQGAILPIAEKYKFHKPFLGAVIAGIFTAPSIEQLKSCGFETLYFEYSDIVKAFQKVGIDASFDEKTPDEVAGTKITSLQKLTELEYQTVFDEIIFLSKGKVEKFKRILEASLDRQVSRIVVAPLYGVSNSFYTIDDALGFTY